MAPVPTPWLSCFNFSPDTTTVTDTNTIIGSNIEEGDGPIERHVLENVGSYGFQLNRIIDVLSIIVDRATAGKGMLSDLRTDDATPKNTMTEDMKSLRDFKDMAETTRSEADKFISERTERAAGRFIQGMQLLKKSDSWENKDLYLKLKKQIEQEILAKNP